MNITRINNNPEVYSITESRRVLVTRSKPRTSNVALTSDTLVTRADGSTYIIAKSARHSKTQSRQSLLLRELARQERQNKLDDIRRVMSNNLPAIDYGA